MKPYLYLILTVLVILVIYSILVYNKLTKKRNMVENQKSQIDIQLKRRFDLIPNLVEVVKGYASHESSTLEAVALARSEYLASKSSTEDALNADMALTQTLSRLFALTESYPDLLANQNFRDLQKELVETEKKISHARQFYNDSVYFYNNLTEQFPSSIVATLFNFKKINYFEIRDSEKESINISI